MSNLNVCLLNTTENFIASKVYACRKQWEILSKEKWIYKVVQGSILEFDSLPVQNGLPRLLNLSVSDSMALDNAIPGFLKKGIVERSISGGQGFFSNVFPVIKSDGTARVIINLKDFNENITHVHFKMESIYDVINLVQHNCFFMSVDFKDAYFSVYVKPDDRK